MTDATTDTQTDTPLDKNLTFLPLLALRDVVVYPHMQIALFVGREQSVKAVELAQAEYNDHIFVITQKDSLTEEIDASNLYQYGTVCRIVNTMPHENDDNCIKVLIEGLYRAKLEEVQNHQTVLMANFSQNTIINNVPIEEHTPLKETLVTLFSQYAEARLRNARELIRVAQRIEDIQELVFFIATRISLSIELKQAYLENDDFSENVQTLIANLLQQGMEQDIEQELQETVRQRMDDSQREYFFEWKNESH